jgi:hypothetical protein
LYKSVRSKEDIRAAALDRQACRLEQSSSATRREAIRSTSPSALLASAAE